jgi:type I restriction enzyme, R subunit
VFNSHQPITRKARVKLASNDIFTNLNDKESEFIDFVLSKYVESGVEEVRAREVANTAYKQISITGGC